MTREIELTQGKVALVDDENYKVLNKYRWYAQRVPNTFYAGRKTPRSTGRAQGSEYMHRTILKVPIGCQIDHINGDGLNNQKLNLRIVTCRGNNQNRHCKKTSRFPGVCWKTKNSAWCAQISINGKVKHLGLFKIEEEAYKAYKQAVESVVIKRGKY